ncbi:threonine synthase [Xanthovirga aplysinae]|uniref:threonine synthase n=1 Tax=Xanthovirga aplysinae TaxID=2529853 RepID=UPI0012BB6652|nr:threonine synthase [Xanthovirga aplysinae]MTI32640.1 threonine synthase [Xanthovirga aplysinae]
MYFYSTNKKSNKTSFKEAVIKGLADDKGLFFPESIPVLPEKFFQNLDQMSLPEIALEVAKPFAKDDIPEKDLENLLNETLNFEIPLRRVEEDIHALELFHGPTRAFKDVGARFMARCLGYFSGEKEVTVLVATSGDTGSAVANGFLGVEGVRVVILYPEGKVSDIQEKQFTTLGNNITALEVKGAFDDCQRMVKQAFMDQELNQKQNLSSANSINIARLLPQSFYYYYAYGQLKDKSKPVIFSVPSGNYGNLTAGLLAKRMGLPVQQFLAASNLNSVVPEFLADGVYQERPSIATISNAMDVGAPSNFVRMQELYGQSYDRMTADISGFSYTDAQTSEALAKIYQRTNYLMDPHGAVGYLALKEYLAKNEGTGIFLETAHPAKFLETVEEIIEKEVEIPEDLNEFLTKEKHSVSLANDFGELKDFLLNN